MVVDPERGRALVFGGTRGVHLSSVQALALDRESPTWQRLAVAGRVPEPRREASVILDPRRHRLVMFGGLGERFLGDLHELSLGESPAWRPLATAGVSPGPRAAHGAIYDARRDRMLVLFGSDGSTFRHPRMNDVWELPFSGPRSMVWRRLRPRGVEPSPRSCFSAVYDSIGDRVIVFGGTDPWFRNDVWQLSLAGGGAWSPIVPAGPRPSPRESHAAAFDPECRVMLVHGGLDSSRTLGDTWLLELAGAPRWVQLDRGRALPPRWGHAAAFDASRRRLVIHGGWSEGYLGETWVLEVMPCVLASDPSPPRPGRAWRTRRG